MAYSKMSYLGACDDARSLHTLDRLVDKGSCQIGVDGEALPVATSANNATHGTDGRPKKNVDTLSPVLCTHLGCSSKGQVLVPAVKSNR